MTNNYYDLCLDLEKDTITQGVYVEKNEDSSSIIFNSLAEYRLWNLYGKQGKNFRVYPVNLINSECVSDLRDMDQHISDEDWQIGTGALVWRDDFSFEEAIKYGEVYGFADKKDFEEWASKLPPYEINEFEYIFVKSISLKKA